MPADLDITLDTFIEEWDRKHGNGSPPFSLQSCAPIEILLSIVERVDVGQQLSEKKGSTLLLAYKYDKDNHTISQHCALFALALKVTDWPAHMKFQAICERWTISRIVRECY